jgi:hypothetical protein
MQAPDALRDAVRARVCAAPRPDAAELAAGLHQRGGDSLAAVVFFGSRKSQANPDAWSAYDFFVIVRGYRAFYASLRAQGALRRPAWLVAALNAVLPPNQVGITMTLSDGRGARAKCAVVSVGAFVEETSHRRHDHFFLGRLCQQTEIAMAADGARREQVVDALAGAHALTYHWVRPWLPARFDVAEYCQTMLRVSFGAEIRPEPSDRARALWEAQQDYLRPVYGVLLQELRASGALVEPEPGVFSVARPATRIERLRLSAYFAWSKVRATVRWAKYVVTFDDWLEFIVRKARRHSGEDIELTARERRMPLVFLWPRVFRYFRHKDR